MALTPLQRRICRLLAQLRQDSGESYVAGGVALGEAAATGRISRDVDLFHDTSEALQRTWASDRDLLASGGFALRVLRERPAFVEAEASADGEAVLIQWAQDSAFRFFPLVRHDELGLTLHPFDLATNKLLALAGRLEPRDWVDLIHAAERIQPLGYLAWAACGKDPGYGPPALLEHAARSGRYSADELRGLAFAGPAPDAGDLARRWHALLAEARAIVPLLPPSEVGKCVVGADGQPFRGDREALARALETGSIHFHAGAIRGAWPDVRPRERPRARE